MWAAYQTAPWSGLINFVIQRYFVNTLATCIFWHSKVNFDLDITPFCSAANACTPVQFIQIGRANLHEDLYDFRARLLEEKFQVALGNDDHIDEDLVLKLTIAIEQTHCENFIVFQEDIPVFARAFRMASVLSVWRSERTKFLFAYRSDLQKHAYFDDPLFAEQPNILILETNMPPNSTQLRLKTNKFIGSRNDNPAQLYLMCSCDVSAEDALCSPCRHNLYPDKIRNLQGREIIVGVFDYRPNVVVDYNNSNPQTYDHSESNPKHCVYLDGSEVRVLLIFCELYNCTVEVDTSEKFEWGDMYENGTGYGLLGQISSGRTHYSVGGLYLWYLSYSFLDISYVLGRASVTLMVPIPLRLTSWNLPIKPFHFTLWLGIIGCLTLETFSLSVVRKFESNPTAKATWSNSLSFGFVTTLKLFISQNSGYNAVTMSMRLLLFACYIIDIIVTSVYSSGLAAVLTTPIHEEAADSVWRLYTHKLLWSGSSKVWITSLEFVKDDVVIESIVRQFRINSWLDMSQLAETEQMGFAIERSTFGYIANSDYLTDTALDRLKLMIDDLYRDYTVAYVPRLWPFLGLFNTVAHAWHAGGLNKIWEWKVTAEHMNIQRQKRMELSRILRNNIGPIKLDLENFSGLIIVWLVGMLSSLLAFAGELLVWQAQKLYAVI